MLKILYFFLGGKSNLSDSSTYADSVVSAYSIDSSCSSATSAGVAKVTGTQNSSAASFMIGVHRGYAYIGGVYTKSIASFIGSILLGFLVVSCAAGGGGGGGGGPIPSGVFSHPSYTFVNSSSTLSDGDLIGSLLLNTEEIQRRVADQLGIEDEAEIYALTEGMDYNLSVEIAGSISSAARTFLSVTGTGERLEVLAQNTVGFRGLYGTLIGLVPSFSIDIVVTYTDPDSMESATFKNSVTVNLRSVARSPEFSDFLSFDQALISQGGTPAVPGRTTGASFTQTLSGVIGVGTTFDSSYNYSDAWTSGAGAVFTGDSTPPPAGVLQGGALDEFVSADLYADGSLSTGISVTISIKNTTSSVANEIADAADLATGTITFGSGTELSAINGNGTSSFIDIILSGTGFSFPAVASPVVNIGAGNLGGLLDTVSQSTAVVTWEFTYSINREFVVAGTPARPGGVPLSRNLTLAEDKLAASFPSGSPSTVLAAYGVVLSRGVNVPTIFFDLVNSTGDSCVINDGTGDVRISIDNGNYNVRSVRPINYEGPADIPSVSGCRLAVSFNGSAYESLALPVSGGANVLSAPNDVPDPLPMDSVVLGAASNSSAACAGANYNCNYATVNLAVTNVDEAPTIRLYVIPAFNTENSVDNFAGSYESVGNKTPSLAPVKGELGDGLGENHLGTVAPVDIGGVSHKVDEHHLRVLDEDFNAARRVESARALDILSTTGRPQNVTIGSVSPAHGEGIFGLAIETPGSADEYGHYNLTVDTDELDYEKFTAEELAANNGKAVYKISITARDPGGKTTTRTFNFEVRDVVYAPVAAPGSSPFAKSANILNGTSGTPLYLLSGIQSFSNGLHRLGTYRVIDPETMDDTNLVYTTYPADIGSIDKLGEVLNRGGPSRQELGYGSNFALIDNSAGGRRLIIAGSGLPRGAVGNLTLMAIHKSLLTLSNVSGNTDTNKTTFAAGELSRTNGGLDPRHNEVVSWVVNDSPYMMLPAASRPLLLNRSAIITFNTGSLLGVLAEGSSGNVSFVSPPGAALPGTINSLSDTINPDAVVGASPRFSIVPAAFLGSRPELSSDLGSLGLDLSASAGNFAIDPVTGAISPVSGFTPEFPGYHYLPVVVYNAGTPLSPSLYATNDIAVVAVSVTDVNTAPVLSVGGSPVGSPVNLTRDENIAAGSEIYRFRISDDNDISHLRAVSDNSGIKVDLGSVSSGGREVVLSFVNSPDYEISSNISARISVSDRGSYRFTPASRAVVPTGRNIMSSSFVINVDINDLAEAPELEVADGEGEIMESAVENATVGSLVISIGNTAELANFDPSNLTFTLVSTAGSRNGVITDVLRAEADANGVVSLKVSDPAGLENLGDSLRYSFTLRAGYRGVSAMSDPVDIIVKILDDPANSDLNSGLDDFIASLGGGLAVSENRVVDVGTHTFPVEGFNLAASNFIKDSDDRNPFTGGAPLINLVPFVGNVGLAGGLVAPGIGDATVVGLTSGTPAQLRILDTDYVDAELFGDISFAFWLLENGVDSGRRDRIMIDVMAADPATTVAYARVTDINEDVSDQTSAVPAYSFRYTQSDYAAPRSEMVGVGNTTYNDQPIYNSSSITASAGPSSGSVIRLEDGSDNPIYGTVTFDNNVYISRALDLNTFDLGIPLNSAVSAHEILRVYSDGGLNPVGGNEFSQYFNLELVNSTDSSGTDTIKITQKQLSSGQGNNTRTYNLLDTIPLFVNSKESETLNFFVRAGTDLTNASARAIAQFNVVVEAAGLYDRATVVVAGEREGNALTGVSATDYPVDYMRSGDYTVVATVATQDTGALQDQNDGGIEAVFTSANRDICDFAGGESAKTGTSQGNGTSQELTSDPLTFSGTGECVVNVAVSENGVRSQVQQATFTLPTHPPVLAGGSLALEFNRVDEGGDFTLNGVKVRAQDPYSEGDSVSLASTSLLANCLVRQNGAASYDAAGEAILSLVISRTGAGYCGVTPTAVPTIDVNEGGIGPATGRVLVLSEVSAMLNGKVIGQALYFEPAVADAVVSSVSTPAADANLGGTTTVTAVVQDTDVLNEEYAAKNAFTVTFRTGNAHVCSFVSTAVSSQGYTTPDGTRSITSGVLNINAPGDCVVTANAASANAVVSSPVSADAATIDQRAPEVELAGNTGRTSGSLFNIRPTSTEINLRITDNDPGDGTPSNPNVAGRTGSEPWTLGTPTTTGAVTTAGSVSVDTSGCTDGQLKGDPVIGAFTNTNQFTVGLTATDAASIACSISVTVKEDGLSSTEEVHIGFQVAPQVIIQTSGVVVPTDGSYAYDTAFELDFTVTDGDDPAGNQATNIAVEVTNSDTAACRISATQSGAGNEQTLTLANTTLQDPSNVAQARSIWVTPLKPATAGCTITINAREGVAMGTESTTITLSEAAPSVEVVRVDNNGNVLTSNPAVSDYSANLKFRATITDNDPGDGSMVGNIFVGSGIPNDHIKDPGSCDVVTSSVTITGTSSPVVTTYGTSSFISRTQSNHTHHSYQSDGTIVITFEVTPVHAGLCEVNATATEDDLRVENSVTTTLNELAPEAPALVGSPPTVDTAAEYRTASVLQFTVRDNDGASLDGANQDGANQRPSVTLSSSTTAICTVAAPATQTAHSFTDNQAISTSSPISFRINHLKPGECRLSATAAEAGMANPVATTIMIQQDEVAPIITTPSITTNDADSYTENIIEVTATNQDPGDTQQVSLTVDDSSLTGCSAVVESSPLSYAGNNIGDTATFMLEVSRDAVGGIRTPGSCSGTYTLSVAEGGVTTTSSAIAASSVNFVATNVAPTVTAGGLRTTSSKVSGSITDYRQNYALWVDVRNNDRQYGGTNDEITIRATASDACAFSGGASASVTNSGAVDTPTVLSTLSDSAWGLSFSDIGTCSISVVATEAGQASPTLTVTRTLAARASTLSFPSTGDVVVDSSGDGSTTLRLSATANDPGASTIGITPTISGPAAGCASVAATKSGDINLASGSLGSGSADITITYDGSSITSGFECTLNLAVSEDGGRTQAAQTSTISFEPDYQVPDLSFGVARDGVNLTGSTATDFPAGYARNQIYTVVADVLSREQGVLTHPSGGLISATFSSSTSKVCDFVSSSAVTATSSGANNHTRLMSSELEFRGTGDCTINVAATENGVSISTRPLTVTVPVHAPQIKDFSLVFAAGTVPETNRTTEGDPYELEFVVQAQDGFTTADSVTATLTDFGVCNVTKVRSANYDENGEVNVSFQVSKSNPAHGYCATDNVTDIVVSLQETGEGPASLAGGSLRAIGIGGGLISSRIELHDALYFDPILKAPTVTSVSFTTSPASVKFGGSTTVLTSVRENDELNEKFSDDSANRIGIVFTTTNPAVCSFAVGGKSHGLFMEVGVASGQTINGTTSGLIVHRPGTCEVVVVASTSDPIRFDNKNSVPMSISVTIPEGTPSVSLSATSGTVSDYNADSIFTATVMDGDVGIDGGPASTVTLNSNASCSVSLESFNGSSQLISVTPGDPESTCVVTVTSTEDGLSDSATFTLSHPALPDVVIGDAEAVISTDLSQRHSKIVVTGEGDAANVTVDTDNSGCELANKTGDGTDVTIFLAQSNGSVGYTDCVDVSEHGENPGSDVVVGSVEITVTGGPSKTLSDRDIPFVLPAVGLELSTPAISSNTDAGVFYPSHTAGTVVPGGTAAANHIYRYLQAVRWFYGETPPVDSVYVSRWNGGINILNPHSLTGHITAYVSNKITADQVFFIDMDEASSRNGFNKVSSLGSAHNASFYSGLLPYNIDGYLRIGTPRNDYTTKPYAGSNSNNKGAFTRTYGTITKSNAAAGDANSIQELITITTNATGSAASGFNLQARLCRMGIISGTDTGASLVAAGKLTCDSDSSALVDSNQAVKIISLSAVGWTLNAQNSGGCDADTLGSTIFPNFSGEGEGTSTNAHCFPGEPEGGSLNVAYDGAKPWHFQHYIAGAQAGSSYATASEPHYMTTNSIYLAEVYPVSADGRQVLGKPIRVIFEIEVK